MLLLLSVFSCVFDEEHFCHLQGQKMTNFNSDESVNIILPNLNGLSLSIAFLLLIFLSFFLANSLVFPSWRAH